MGGTVFETTINSTCKGHLSKAGGLYILASCTGSPPTTANVFAKGCLMIQEDGSTNTTYENTGTSASPSWNLIGSVSTTEQSTAARTRVVSVPFKLPAPTGANQGPFTIPLMTCSQALTIVSVNVLSDLATSGSDASNQYQFQARNITGAADLHTVVTTTQGSELSATTAKTITVSQNLSFTASQVFGLKVDIVDDAGAGPTNLSGANLLCVIEYTI